MLWFILVRGFCPLKIKITQFPDRFCLNTFWLGSQEKPGTKPEAKPDSEGDNADEESEGEAAKTDDKEDTELIRTEGKPGWWEKVLKKVWIYFAIRRSNENTQKGCYIPYKIDNPIMQLYDFIVLYIFISNSSLACRKN